MRILRPNLIVFAVVGLTLAGCSSMSNYVPPFIKPYKYDIQQGNFVTREDTDKLRIGMTKDEVRYLLGTPLLNDAFHADRWDYVFRLLKADGIVMDARYTVQFQDGKLTRHGGEGLPANQAEANLVGKKDDRAKRPIEPVSNKAAEPAKRTDSNGAPDNAAPVPSATLTPAPAAATPTSPPPASGSEPAQSKQPSAVLKRKVAPINSNRGTSEVGGTETAPELK